MHTVESLGMDREDEFPNWAKTIHRGGLLCASGGVIEAAQDRVAMRRYIRRHFPSLGVSLRDMKGAELSQMVDEIRDIRGKS